MNRFFLKIFLMCNACQELIIPILIYIFQKNTPVVRRQSKNFSESGVSVMSQWLMNPTGNHEVAGSIPGLTQWAQDPVLQWP